MPFEHACFVSYRHHEQSQLAEKFIDDLCAALRNELSVLVDEDIYIDRERMRGGVFFNAALARALCRSVCMVVVYTPTYFSLRHIYCAREYRAMEQLEQRRLAKLDRALSAELGLIIPIVLRGEAMLPAGIRTVRQYYNFERFSLTSRELAKNRHFEESVREIAGVIHQRRQMLAAPAADLVAECDGFMFPAEDEVRPWLTDFVTPLSPFPFRAAG